MPITAKLSREFYERFGDKVVNEMVDLFNRIDAASRSDLDRLNETNALRFEAKLAAVDERLSARIQALDDRLSARLSGLESRVASLESAVTRIDKKVADFPAVLEKALHTQTRWMLGAWGILLASQIALWLR